MVKDLLVGPPEMSPTTIFDFSLRDIQRNSALLEQFRDPIVHAAVLWDGIECLQDARNEVIPRILGIIDMLNVEQPELLALSHSQLISRQLEALLHNFRFNKKYGTYSPEAFEKVIENIQSRGVIARYIDWTQSVREGLGIATPVPSFGVIQKIHDTISNGNPLPGLKWNAHTIDEVAQFMEGTPFNDIAALYPVTGTFTTTGFNRNLVSGLDVHDALRRYVRPSGTYVEVGASLGAFAVDTKRVLRSSRLITTDIMSEASSRAITTVFDYKADKPLLFTDAMREEIEAQIDTRLWGHDILRSELAASISREEGQYTFGLHNVTVHLLPKDVAVRNTTTDFLQMGDVLWMSGGYCANEEIICNHIWERTPSGLALRYMDGHKTNRRILSKEDLVEAVNLGKGKKD